MMNEGRKSQIVLPDERRLDLLIQPKLTSRDLLDLVASHFKLKEKEYFGLCYQDESGHQNWLNLDKRVLEHDFARRAGTLILIFAVRFYVESIASLRDIQTVEVFFLNAKQAIFKGQIECDSETVFELAALVLQVTHGDFTSDENAKNDLKKLPVIPTYILREHPSIQYCEEKVISYYKKIAGSTRGLAIVNYLSIVESLPTYGTHYYEVKDKKDHPWWLGLSYKGIAVYDKTDKTTPRKVFNWKQLENLYYRDKKFSIEVHDTKRIVHTLSSFNLYEDAVREPPDEFDELSDAISDPTTQVSVSRRTFGPGNVLVHAWFGASPQITKCIWCMAVAQHQFYLDRKHNKPSLPQARSVSEIAAELSRSTSSLQGSLGSDSISRSGSSASLPSLTTSRFDLNCDPSVEAVKAQREMYTALKARKEALEEAVNKKLQELKQLCIQEGELTGCLPLDYPQQSGEPLPTIRKRVGTAFSLASKVSDNKTDDALSNLELEYELQKQITSAAKKLSQDKSVSKYVRKQRRQSLHRAQAKLKEMEKKLCDSKGEKGHFLPSGVPSFDGMYSVVNQSIVEKEYNLDQCLSNTFCDDMLLAEKRRGKRSVTSRLYKSFRERYSVKGRLNKSYLDNPDRHNNNSILEASFLVGSICEKTQSLNRTVHPVLEIPKVTPVLKSSSSSGSTNSTTSSASSGYHSIPSPTRASWQSYQYEKMCHELTEKPHVESQV